MTPGTFALFLASPPCSPENIRTAQGIAGTALDKGHRVYLIEPGVWLTLGD